MSNVQPNRFRYLAPPREWLQDIREKYTLPALQLSYYPANNNRPSKWSEKYGLPEQQLLATIKADLSNGITIVASSKPTTGNQKQLHIRGKLWEITVSERLGATSHAPVCILQGITKRKYPNKEILIKPVRVSFDPIWDERPFDCSSVKDDYQKIKREIESLEHKLLNPDGDVSVRKHALDLSKARKQYSALRVMTNLLRLKSEQSRHELEALVMQPTSDIYISEDATENSDSNLFLKITSKIPGEILTEGDFVELSVAETKRPLRTSILTIHSRLDGLILELDIPSHEFSDVQHVTLRTISRFSMWAHEQAVTAFLNENVHGYWRNLAHLLCSPDEIIPPSRDATISEFYCDQNTDSPSLNEKQRQAVIGAVNAPSTFCIQGPPGTGKTTVICEIVQHLVARGERVLMVAPTHVAIDEVLRRIGARPHVNAIRLSWDDSRVAEDVRQYTPTSLSNPLFKAISNSSQKKTTDWNFEKKQLDNVIQLLNCYTEKYRKKHLSSLEQGKNIRDLKSFRQKYAKMQPVLLDKQETLWAAIVDHRNQRENVAAKLAKSKLVLTRVKSGAGFAASLLGTVGLGPIGTAGRKYTTLSSELNSIDSKITELNTEESNIMDSLESLNEQLPSKIKKLSDSEQNYSNDKEQLKIAIENCQSNDLLSTLKLDPETAISLHKVYSERAKRVTIYPELSKVFQNLTGSKEFSDQGALQKDLISSANLFCCTTTGVAGSKELRNLSFDTLIVDEASRVTDSEFLIGANKAKRWILVGDEFQLPPYVEQQDEHFIHALSAIYRTEKGNLTLEDSVNALGEIWKEDEELHIFRNESVLKYATELQKSGLWDNFFRAEYSSGIQHLKSQISDPTKALLDAMRKSIVHSLFERVVNLCPSGAKIRLAEQRRMIEPIARIVSQPVYGGDYQSPSEEELAISGVTPLVTTTFKTPITFLDTSALGMKGREELKRNSFVNKAEIDLIIKACLILERETTHLSTDRITVSILAFYKAQARLISKELDKHRFQQLKFSVIDAIDRIQGQESDVVFLSFTRTRGKHVSSHFGQWLQDIRRLNVACTRAHRALFLVGQKDMLTRLHSNEQAIAFYRNLDNLFNKYPEHMTIIKQLGNS